MNLKYQLAHKVAVLTLVSVWLHGCINENQEEIDAGLKVISELNRASGSVTDVGDISTIRGSSRFCLIDELQSLSDVVSGVSGLGNENYTVSDGSFAIAAQHESRIEIAEIKRGSGLAFEETECFVTDDTAIVYVTDEWKFVQAGVS